jgi:hypothetical protein
MESLHLSFDDVMLDIKHTIDEYGEDYVYFAPDPNSGCVYFDEDTHKPSCLVGHVLARHGVTFEDLTVQNHDTEVSALIQEEFLIVDQRTKRLLAGVQARQDNMIPWGEAVRLTLAEVNKPKPVEFEVSSDE